MDWKTKAVSVKDLRVSYGKVTALSGIDLELEFGQPVALLGPNGAGKTTLINVLTTMLKRFDGQAMVAGMKRRLVYARTMLHNPQMVFLDEPTTGLDVQSRYALWEDIENFSAQNRSIVLTTHYIEEAERFCKRIIVIDKGRIIADGSPESLKTNDEKTLEEVILNLTGKELTKK